MTEKTKFKIRGDASVWEVISYDSATGIIQARNLSNDFIGPIAKANVIKIVEVATSFIPSENIKIIEPDKNVPSYGDIKEKKRGGRKKKLI